MSENYLLEARKASSIMEHVNPVPGRYGCMNAGEAAKLRRGQDVCVAQGVWPFDAHGEYRL